MRGFDDLRVYQRLALDFLGEHRRCNLYAGMGIGKTVIVETLLDLLNLSGHTTQPTLILAPKRVASLTWPDEVQDWEHLQHLDVSPVVGTEKQRIAALQRDVPIYTANYDILPWLMEHLGDRFPFGTVVPDESTRLKSFRGSQQVSKKGAGFVRGGGGVRSRAIAKVAHTKVQRWINLSGTPSPNGLIDLWGQMWFIDQGARLGRTFSAFTGRWFRAVPGSERGQLEPLPFAQEQIQDAIRDVTLTIEAKDWFDLKEPIINKVRVQLPPAVRDLYRKMEREFFFEIEGHGIEAFDTAAKSQKLLQLANGAVYLDPEVPNDDDPRARAWKVVHDAKIEALESIVNEAAGMPVLVAYNFKSDLARLLKAFPKGRHLDANPQTARDWNAGKIPLLFAHPASAGHGLSLQHGGNILAFFGLNWNLEEHLQIIERIGPTRQAQSGYDRPVFLHYIVAEDTIDDTVLLRLSTKRRVQDLLLEAMKRRHA